jgi:hypothetical protein
MKVKRRKKPKLRVSPVQRITVDERLADDMIRFEICELREGVEKFAYEIDVWERGIGLIVNEDAYGFDLGIPYPWDNLEEGDVFLIGGFEPVDDEDETDRYRVNPSIRGVLKIDHLDEYRDYLRALYSDVLRGGTRSA